MIASVGRQVCVWAWDTFRFRAAHDGSLESIKKCFHTMIGVLDLVHFRGSEVCVEHVSHLA